MSLGDVLENAGSGGFPRVSGDEPFDSSPGASWVTFSPRERG